MVGKAPPEDVERVLVSHGLRHHPKALSNEDQKMYPRLIRGDPGRKGRIALLVIAAAAWRLHGV
jgi:hypothetical protein